MMNFKDLKPSVLTMAAAAFLLGACAKQSPISTKRQISTGDSSRLVQLSFANDISVVDAESQPIAGAKIQIGAKAGDPFANNIITTDANGTAAIPAEWTTAQPVTVSADGYVRATFFDMTPQALQFPMHAIAKTTTELTGKTTGYADLSKDGVADVGVVFPTLSRAQMFAVSVSDLISPDTDQMTAFGQTVDVPSNFSIPKQVENYIFDITFEKPIYRMTFGSGAHKVASAHVRFPFHDTIDAARAGKGFMELIDLLDFREINVQDLTLTGAQSSVTFPVNTIPLAKNVKITAPKYGSSYSAFIVSLSDNGGVYVVNDVKHMPSGGAVKLASVKTPTAPTMVVAAMRRTANENSTSGAVSAEMSTVMWLPTEAAKNFLPITKAPAVSGQNLVLAPPAATADAEAIMTAATLYKIEVAGGAQVPMEKRTPQWELYSAGWQSGLALPDVSTLAPIAMDTEVPDPTRAKPKQRWEVSFVGGAPGSSQVQPGPGAYTNATHVTRNAVDL